MPVQRALTHRTANELIPGDHLLKNQPHHIEHGNGSAQLCPNRKHISKQQYSLTNCVQIKELLVDVQNLVELRFTYTILGKIQNIFMTAHKQIKMDPKLKRVKCIGNTENTKITT